MHSKIIDFDHGSLKVGTCNQSLPALLSKMGECLSFKSLVINLVCHFFQPQVQAVIQYLTQNSTIKCTFFFNQN